MTSHSENQQKSTIQQSKPNTQPLSDLVPQQNPNTTTSYTTPLNTQHNLNPTGQYHENLTQQPKTSTSQYNDINSQQTRSTASQHNDATIQQAKAMIAQHNESNAQQSQPIVSLTQPQSQSQSQFQHNESSYSTKPIITQQIDIVSGAKPTITTTVPIGTTTTTTTISTSSTSHDNDLNSSNPTKPSMSQYSESLIQQTKPISSSSQSTDLSSHVNQQNIKPSVPSHIESESISQSNTKPIIQPTTKPAAHSTVTTSTNANKPTVGKESITKRKPITSPTSPLSSYKGIIIAICVGILVWMLLQRNHKPEVKHQSTLEKTKESIQNKLNEANVNLKNTYEHTAENIKNVLHGTADTAKNIGDKMKSSYNENKNTVQENAGTLKEKLNEVKENVIGTTKETIESLKEKSQQTMENVKATSESTMEKAKEALGNLKDKSQQTMENVKTSSGATYEATMEKAKETMDTIKEKSQQTMESMKASSESTMEKAKETMGNLKDKSQQTMENVKASSIPIMEATVEKAKETMDTLKEKSQQTMENVKASSVPIMEATMEKAKETMGTLKEKSQQTMENVKVTSEATMEKAKETYVKTQAEVEHRLTMEGLIEQAQLTLQEFLSPHLKIEELIPVQTLSGAKAVVFLTVVKGGIGISGVFGSGIIIARNEIGHWSGPCAIASVGVDIGLNIGVQKSNHILILRDDAAVSAFTSKGQFKLGMDASVAVGPKGRDASVGLSVGDKGYAATMSYSMATGAYLGLSLEGAIIVVRNDCNEEYYGKKVDASKILEGAAKPPKSKALNEIYKIIDEYTAENLVYPAHHTEL